MNGEWAGPNRGASTTTGLASASLWPTISFSWITPFIDRAFRHPLEDNDAYYLLPDSDSTDFLARRFQRTYTRLQAAHPENQHRTARTLLQLYRPLMLLQSAWMLAETAVRLVTAVMLRGFLDWLIGNQAASGQPQWRGWAWAAALACCSFGMTLVHHQLFWFGYRMGFCMRLQTVAAIHEKVLRLNSAAVAALSPGFIVNIISNDVRRFDDIGPFWVYIWGGPLELACVMLMVTLELGFLPALAGVSVTLLVIPLQAALVQPIGRLRKETAQRTDERVRLTGEAINGALAMKMLGWEAPLAAQLAAIRAEEAQRIAKMSRIRAVNMTLLFCITPIITFATFATYRLTGGYLSIGATFYALALLQLPRNSMVNCFVLGVQTMTELRVSLRRIDGFLDTPEPPLPPHQQHPQPPSHKGAQQQQAGKEQQSTAAAGTNGTSHHPASPVANGAPRLSLGSLAAADAACVVGAAVGTVVMRSADFDWARPMGQVGEDQEALSRSKSSDWHPSGKVAEGDAAAAAAPPSDATAVDGATGRPAAPAASASTLCCLRGIDFELRPGELLGVCGEVGSGKSSLLAALLGELQPLLLPAPLGGSGAQGASGGAARSPASRHLAGLRLPISHGSASQLTDADLGLELEDIPLLSQASVAATASGANGHAAASAPANGHAVDDGDRGDGGETGTAPAGGRHHHIAGPLVVGSVAYCAQASWIVAGSVRDNISFGLPFDEDWYRQVISACALEQDILELPGGDSTELGERGINLSGGQKARIALARACYSRAAVALLDDPLSAVDPRVGRVLFDQCLGPTGLMQGTTRVLVTHQRHFLPLCDRVLVLRGGAIAALGDWTHIDSLQLHELIAGANGATSLEDGGAPPAAASGDWLTTTQPNGNAPTPNGAAVASEEAADPFAHRGIRMSGAFGSRTPAVAPTPRSSEEGSIIDLGQPAAPPPGTPPRSEAADGMAEEEDGEETPALRGNNNNGGGGGSDDDNGGPSTPDSRRAWRRRSGFTGVVSDVNFHRSPSQRALSWSKSTFSQFRMPRMFGGAASPRVGSWRWRDTDGSSFANRLASAAAAPKAAGMAGAVEAPGQLGTPPSGRLVLAEERIIGSVAMTVYLDYARQVGAATSVLIAGAMMVGQVVWFASDWWLALWANASDQDQRSTKWLIVYASLTVAIVIVSAARAVLFFEAAIAASTRLHALMVDRVLRAPLSFFHTNPAGRILNRFSKDLGQVDDLLPITLFDCCQCGFLCLGALVLVSIAVPFILPFFIPLLILFYMLRQRYVAASRQVKRWEAVSRSPVFAFFSATLKGLPTIRAYSAQSRFGEEFVSALGFNGAWYFAVISCARWVGIRLDFLASLTLSAACVLAMVTRNLVSPNLLGLALTHVINLCNLAQWFIRQTAEVENNMTSVERMLEYATLPQEPPRVEDGGGHPPPAWPQSGRLRYEHVTATYRPGLPPVLRDINFELKGGSSCGVVGRTGSGKSSLLLTLFRLIDVDAGTICLDGVDITTVGIDALRRQLAIIPQDPTLFSGTLRSNLDPWGLHPDSRLWEVLEQVRLKPAVSAMGGLLARVSEAGDNLSAGQRQLLCLGRALLQEARVLALDEATANVDRATDALIQDALHDFTHKGSEATQRVLLIIAHRIDTILHCDNLLVLSAGQLVESGAPQRLAKRSGGTFAGMVAAARLANVHTGAAGPA